KSHTSCTAIAASPCRCSCYRTPRAPASSSRCWDTRRRSGVSATGPSSSSRASRSRTSSGWRRSSRQRCGKLSAERESTMKTRWAIAAVSALALAILTLPADPWTSFESLSAAGGVCPANAKPANLNFTLKDLNNKDVKLSLFKGKVILLDFWATWCGPCKIEIPWFIEFQNKYKPQGLEVVGVSVDDTIDKLKPYVAQMKMNYLVLQGLDHDDLQDAFGPIFGIPVTVLISRDGRMCTKHTGLSSKDAFEHEIKSLLERGSSGPPVV